MIGLLLQIGFKNASRSKNIIRDKKLQALKSSFFPFTDKYAEVLQSLRVNLREK